MNYHHEIIKALSKKRKIEGREEKNWENWKWIRDKN